MGGSRLLHVEDTVQTHANPAGFNQRQHVFTYTAQNLSLLLIRTGAQARGVHRQAAGEHIPQVHFCFGAAHQTDNAQVPAVGEGVQVVVQVLSAHNVEDVVGAASASFSQQNFTERMFGINNGFRT